MSSEDRKKTETGGEKGETGGLAAEAVTAGAGGTVPNVDAKPAEPDEPVADDAEKVSESDAAEETGERKPETAEEATEAEATAPEPVTVVQNVPARSDGFARFVAVVALIIAGGTLALSQFPQVPKGSAARLAAVEQRVDGISAPDTGSVDAAALQAEIAALRDRVAAADEKSNELSLLIDELRTAQLQLAGSGQEDGERAAGIEARLEALTGRIASVEARPSAPTVSVQPASPAADNGEDNDAELALLAGELSALKSEIARIEGRQSELSSDIDSGVESVRADLNAALDNRADDLSRRLDEVAAATAASAEADNNELAGRAALVLAAGQLKDASTRDAPYKGAWQAVTALGVADADYPAIAAGASTGVPSLNALKARFSAAASDAIVADQVGEGDSWAESALKRVGSLVRIRRTGELEGSDPQAILGRAEVRLNDSDLAAAVDELEALSGAAAAEMLPWLEDARKRLAVDAEVAALQSSLVAGIAGRN